MGEKPKRRENILETSNCNNGVFSDCFRIDYCLRELFPQFRHRNDYAEKGYTSAFDCFCNFYDVSSCNHRRIFLPLEHHILSQQTRTCFERCIWDVALCCGAFTEAMGHFFNGDMGVAINDFLY